MPASQPLTGNELISCARANSEQAIHVAAYHCGYGDNIHDFKQALVIASKQMGVSEITFSDLNSNNQNVNQTKGLQIAPDTINQL